MNAAITPYQSSTVPHPGNTTCIVVAGSEFTVSWDGEPGEPATYCDGAVSVAETKPSAWVEGVRLDGHWWEAREVFAEPFCAQMNAALMEVLQGEFA